jgi:hypothetical protein
MKDQLHPGRTRDKPHRPGCWVLGAGAARVGLGLWRWSSCCWGGVSNGLGWGTTGSFIWFYKLGIYWLDLR